MAGREQIARPPRDGQSQGTVGPKGDEGMVMSVFAQGKKAIAFIASIAIASPRGA